MHFDQRSCFRFLGSGALYHLDPHGPIGNRAALIEFRDMLVAIREKVAGLKKQGMTVFEVIATKPTAAFDAKWGQFLITPSAFTGLVYQGVLVDRLQQVKRRERDRISSLKS